MPRKASERREFELSWHKKKKKKKSATKVRQLMTEDKRNIILSMQKWLFFHGGRKCQEVDQIWVQPSEAASVDFRRVWRADSAKHGGFSQTCACSHYQAMTKCTLESRNTLFWQAGWDMQFEVNREELLFIYHPSTHRWLCFFFLERVFLTGRWMDSSFKSFMLIFIVVRWRVNCI